MGKQKKSKSVNVNIPVNLPQPPATILSGPSLEAREKQLSFRDGLLKKRRQDPSAFVRDDDQKQQQPQLYSPMVLHSNLEECLKRTREPPSDRTRLMMSRATILMVHWLSRADTRTLSSCTLFGMGDFATLMHGQHRPMMKQSSKYSTGWRLYSLLERLKMDYYGQVMSGGNPQAKLSEFWHSLDGKNREQVLRQELAARLRTFRPTWCVCNCCKHRRISMTDVLDQLLRAYCEDLDSAIRHLSTKPTDPFPNEHDKSRRQLFKSVSLVTAGGVAARRRPVFDVLAAFTGLCFTDHQGGDDDSEDEGMIEYHPDDEEDDNFIHQWCDDEECCSCDRRHEEDDLDGDVLDFSDDDEVMEAMEGELGVEECELMGPIASNSRRPSKQVQFKALLSVDDPEAVENALIVDGKSVYQLFAAELFLHRLLLTYMEAETRRKQMELLEEEEEAARRAAEKKERKAAKRLMKRRKEQVGEPAVIEDGAVTVDTGSNTGSITVSIETCIDTGTVTASSVQETFIDTAQTDQKSEPDQEGDTENAPEAENDGNSANKPEAANTTHTPPDDFDTIDKAIRDRLSLDDPTEDLAPPGFDTSMPPGFDDNGPSINYNYWTSSVFGPSLFQPFL